MEKNIKISPHIFLILLPNRSPVSARAALLVHRSSNVAFIPYSLNIRERIRRSWCGLGMAKFSHRCDMYCTRLPGRIFKRLDRDEVDRETSLSEACTCYAGIFGIGLSTTTTTLADERSVIKSRAGEYRDSNGSLCNPTFFATGKKGTVYSTTGRHPLSFTVHVPPTDAPVSVGRNKSRLANTGRSTEVLLHSRDRSVDIRHAYL